VTAESGGEGGSGELPEEAREFVLRCPVPLPPGEHVLLGHGSGGKLTASLIRELLVPVLGDPSGELARLGDAAVVEVHGTRLAFTTDAFVVQPMFFPGSNIGELAVFGTVNDLAMMGARPLFLSAAFILEEGLPLESLGAVITAMAEACRKAGVSLVTGDTKVVERGSADGLFVTTSGIGIVPEGVDVGPERARPGDRVIVSGPVGSHGVAVMSRRAGVEFEAELVSDTAPLTGLVESMLAAGDVRCLRDATRGGIASVLNELAQASGVSITVREGEVPVLPPVRAACEMLGLDPLYVANEGVCVAIVAPGDADAVLAAARQDPLGAHASSIGEVDEGPPKVSVRTGLGATRPLLMLAGDQLPRIC
jgi:hydrogenase expression/formation protein HypE